MKVTFFLSIITFFVGVYNLVKTINGYKNNKVTINGIIYQGKKAKKYSLWGIVISMGFIIISLLSIAIHVSRRIKM